MDAIRDFFSCSACQCRTFRQVYSFSIVFHTVNFSDDLIYDRVTEESFECTACGKIHTKEEVEVKLRQFKRTRRSSD